MYLKMGMANMVAGGNVGRGIRLRSGGIFRMGSGSTRPGQVIGSSGNGGQSGSKHKHEHEHDRNGSLCSTSNSSRTGQQPNNNNNQQQ